MCFMSDDPDCNGKSYNQVPWHNNSEKKLTTPLHHVAFQKNKSCWLELFALGLNVEPCHLVNVEKGAEFVYIHNRDNNHFMKIAKFERFILKKTKAVE